MKQRIFFCIVIMLMILLGTVYASWTEYEDLDCEVRFNLEGWYMDRHPGEPRENATFIDTQLQSLTVDQACEGSLGN